MANEIPNENNDGVTLPHGSHNARPSSNGFSARKDPHDSSSTSPPNGQHDVARAGWSKQYLRPVTLAELQDINGNLAHFFSLMLSWEKQFKERGLLHEADESKEATV